MKKLILFAIAIATLVSCTEPIKTDNSGDEKVIFIFHSATSTWKADDKIGIFMVESGGANVLRENVLYTTTPAGASANNFNSSTPILYPQEGKIDFWAYYPYQSGMVKNICKLDVTDQTDLNAISFMVATKKDESKTKLSQNLEFKQILSNLDITVNAGDDMTDADLMNLKVELLGTKSTATYNISDSSIVLGDEASITLKTDASGLKSAGAVIPQKLNEQVELRFTTTNHGTFTTKLSVTEFVAGGAYPYITTINSTGVEPPKPPIPEKVIKVNANGSGETLTLDFGRVIEANDINWSIGGVTVSLKSGTTYNVTVSANVGVTWNKTTLGTNTITPSTESDPDAIPTFGGTGGLTRKFIGTIAGVLRVEISQNGSPNTGSVDFEYYGRYGSPLAKSEQIGKNAGHTRKRAVVTIVDSPTGFIWGEFGEETSVINKWNGLANTNVLFGLKSDFPAAEYCNDLGDGWYLPAQNQLAAAWIVHSALTSFSALNYWSSTENDNFYNSWLVDFRSGKVNEQRKDNNSEYVRCIRDL